MLCCVCQYSVSNRILLIKRLFDNFRRLSFSFKRIHTIPTTSDCATNAQKSSVIGPIGPIIGPPAESAAAAKMKGVGQATDGTVAGISSAQLKGFPTPPARELCCGSGCPNCVWIQFADEVMEYVKRIPPHDGMEQQQKKMVNDVLTENVEDDNLRVYLLMEIRAKGI